MSSSVPREAIIELASFEKAGEITDFMQPVYADNYPNSRGITREMFENDVFHVHMQKYLEGKLRDPAVTLWVARSAGQIAGTIGLEVPVSEPSSGEIWGFYVATRLRSRGFGRLLWSTAMQDERLQTFDNLHLHVAKNLLRAIDFYKEKGFSVTSEEVWDWPSWTEEKLTNDYWIMQKNL